MERGKAGSEPGNLGMEFFVFFAVFSEIFSEWWLGCFPAGLSLTKLCCCFPSSSLYKAPWARVLVYGLGHKVKRNGQLNLIEAVCYPRDASPTNTGLTPPPTTNQYPAVITPTDRVHIKLGEHSHSTREKPAPPSQS